jgi:hypothetical protein
MGLGSEIANEIASQKIYENFPKIEAGSYLFCVRKILSKKGFSGNYVIAEFDVVESSPLVSGITPNTVGSVTSARWPLTTGIKGEAMQRNIKQFFCALFGIAPDNASEIVSAIDDYLGDDNKEIEKSKKARGILVRAKAEQSVVQRGETAGQTRVYTTFTHVPENAGNTSDEIAARRKQIDLRSP